MAGLLRYLRGQFEACRADPRPGLMSALVEAEEAGDKLSTDELLAMVFLLLVAGIETTVHLLSVGTHVLLQHDEQRARLVNDWSGIAAATDELLRYVTPVQMTKPRHVRSDSSLYGVDLERGQYLIAILAAANADPEVFESPETLDLTRHPNPHVSFGRGVHSCLGLQLARAEAETAFQQLFTRWPGLRLAVPPEKLSWSKCLGIRGLTSLPLRVR